MCEFKNGLHGIHIQTVSTQVNIYRFQEKIKPPAIGCMLTKRISLNQN